MYNISTRFARLLAGLLALLAGTAAVSAQNISFVSNLALPGGQDFILTQSMVVGDVQYLATATQLYASSPLGGTWTLLESQFPATMKTGPGTDVTISGDFLRLTGARNSIYIFNTPSLQHQGTITAQGPQPGIALASPLDSPLGAFTDLALLSNNVVWSINGSTGVGTPIVNSTGSGPGQLSGATQMAFGPDGLLYVLDYGNNRIESFNFTTGSLQGSFTLAAGQVTGGGSSGMVISPYGHIYVGDGLGGFTAYDLSGNFLGAFSSGAPDPGYSLPNGGKGFITTDSFGDISVFDPATGYHEFFETIPGVSSRDDLAHVTTPAEPLMLDSAIPYALEAGVISGDGGLTKTGPGTSILFAANTYTGATLVSAGTLQLRATNASTAYEIAAGATLEILTNTLYNSIYFPTTTYSGGGTLRKTGSLDVAWPDGAVTFALGPGSLIDVEGGDFIGAIAGSSGENWANNHSSLNVAAGASFVGAGANIRVDALTGAGSISSGDPDVPSYQAFTFGVDNGSGTFSGTLRDGQGIGNFVKAGTGTQVLSGTSTYTGTTTINGGKLIVDGSIASSTFTLVNAGGTLGGHGAVGPVIINAGGTISPGNSPGTLTTGGETWNNGGSYVWEINDAGGAKGTGYDWLNLGGPLTLDGTPGGTFTIYVTSLTLGNAPGPAADFVPGQTYTFNIATAAMPIGNFSADQFHIDTRAFFNDPANAGNFAIGLSEDGLSVDLTYTAVPEPQEWGVILGAAFGGLAFMRRQRRG